METESDLRARLTAAVARGDGRAEATIRFGLGDAARRRGALAEARTEYRRAAELFRASGAVRDLSTTLNNLGLVDIALNDPDRARESFGEALDLSSRAGDLDAVRRLLGNSATAASDAGHFEAARQLHERALEIATSSGDVAGMARALSNLAWTELRSGHDSAAKTSDKAVALAAEINDPRLLGAITHTHALVCLREQRYDQSIREAEWCRRTFAYVGDADWVALAASTAAFAAAAGGAWSAVVSSVSAALGSIAAGQLRRGIAQRCVGLASVAAKAGEVTVAEGLCDLAISVAETLGDEALGDAARAQRSESDPVTARGANVLNSCRAMFRPGAPALTLVEPPWLDRRYGERPSAPAPIVRGRTLMVGPLTLLDLTADGHGWSLFCDVSQLLRTDTNYDAEERIRALIERQDPILAKRLEYDTEADNVSIIAKSREDILLVAAWVLSLA